MSDQTRCCVWIFSRWAPVCEHIDPVGGSAASSCLSVHSWAALSHQAYTWLLNEFIETKLPPHLQKNPKKKRFDVFDRLKWVSTNCLAFNSGKQNEQDIFKVIMAPRNAAGGKHNFICFLLMSWGAGVGLSKCGCAADDDGTCSAQSVFQPTMQVWRDQSIFCCQAVQNEKSKLISKGCY